MAKTKVKAGPTIFKVKEVGDTQEGDAEVYRATDDPGVINIRWMCGNTYEITETALRDVIRLLGEMPVGAWISLPLLDEDPDVVFTVKRYGRATTRVKLFTNDGEDLSYFTFNLSKAVAAIEAALEPKG